MDIATASITELRAEYVRLAGVVVNAQNTRKAIQQEVNRRMAAVRAQTLITSMTEIEREALQTELEATETTVTR